jgi:LPS-assembly protein
VSFARIPTHRLPVCAVLLALAIAGASPALAQQETGFDTSKQWKIDHLGKNHVKLTGAVEAQRGDMTFFADEIEVWTDTNRVVATGNVVFAQGGSRIAADRADFNTETRLGTFFNATGSAILTSEPKREMLGSQDADVYFYGDQIEKIGFKKYKIVNGGFTTCVQPTPRWEVTSSTVILNLDHYAFLTNALLKAKSLPVLYFPVLFYPINKEDRATGFLMPVYGTSSYRGFTLSNAFFWAINRSQDATLMHDWFTKRGQGVGGEYRYVAGPGSQGYLRVYNLREHASTDSAGNTLAGTTSYDVKSNASYTLGGGWSARARVDYFTSLQTQQRYNTNIYDTSRSQRSVSGGVSGQFLGLGVNGSYDWSEYFSGTTNSAVTGSTPRLQVSKGERPLFGSLIYFSANGEYVRLVRQYKAGDSVTDNGLTRLDFAPVLRVPFTKLRWVTINSSVTWRDTYWTRSLDTSGSGAVVDQPVSRRFFDLQSRITGPMFNRVWNTPNSGYAEKWKHVIEPSVTVQRITAIDNANEIVKLDGADYTVGRTTRVNYALSNRLLVKRKGGDPGAPPGAGSSREIVSLNISQTYYTDASASQYDYNYTTSFSGRKPSNFSPISATLTVSPTDRINGNLHTEYDRDAHLLQSLSANALVSVSEWLNLNAGFSQRKTKSTLVPPPPADNTLNASTTLKSPGNRVGGGYTFNYDIGRSTLLNSRVIAYYNAQCCGLSFEYQSYNFPSSANVGIPKDARFSFSITLAGLGSFSPFFGALSGTPR